MQKPEPIINLAIPVTGVQEILRALGKRPYDEVAALVNDIARQANEQVDAVNKAQKAEQ